VEKFALVLNLPSPLAGEGGRLNRPDEGLENTEGLQNPSPALHPQGPLSLFEDKFMQSAQI
jgi:hypothetical protein